MEPDEKSTVPETDPVSSATITTAAASAAVDSSPLKNPTFFTDELDESDIQRGMERLLSQQREWEIECERTRDCDIASLHTTIDFDIFNSCVLSSSSSSPSETSEDEYISQKIRRAKLESNCRGTWEDFYYHYHDSFFRDKHWVLSEIPEIHSYIDRIIEQDSSLKKQRMGIVEIGCGVGNSLIPLFQKLHKYPIDVIGLDISGIATDIARDRYEAIMTSEDANREEEEKEQDRVDLSLCKAHVSVHNVDVSNESLQTVFVSSHYDSLKRRPCTIGLLIFVLSSVPPSRHFDFMRNVFDHAMVPVSVNEEERRKDYPCYGSELLKSVTDESIVVECGSDDTSMISSLSSSKMKNVPFVFFRDYAEFDFAQLRFKGAKKLSKSEPWYVRGDGTLSYFFSKEYLKSLVKQLNQRKDTDYRICMENMKYCQRIIRNRKTCKQVKRIFIQCKFCKVPKE